MMASRIAKCDENGNGAEEKSEKDVNARAKVERDVVDEVSGAAEVEDDTIDSVNADKELGIVVEAYGIPNTDIVDESVKDRRIDIVEAVEIAGVCGIVKAANKVLAGEIEEHSEVLGVGVLVILAGGSSPILDG